VDAVGDDPVDHARVLGPVVRGLEHEHLGLRGDRADRIDVEVDFGGAAAIDRAAVDRDHLGGRAGDSVEPRERGRVTRVERREGDDRDSLALARDTGCVQCADVVCGRGIRRGQPAGGDVARCQHGLRVEAGDGFDGSGESVRDDRSAARHDVPAPVEVEADVEQTLDRLGGSAAVELRPLRVGGGDRQPVVAQALLELGHPRGREPESASERGRADEVAELF
jgi:hypothetical protein